MPHNLVAKIRGNAPEASEAAEATATASESEGEEPALVDTADMFITLRTDADLARAFDEAEKARQMVQVGVFVRFCVVVWLVCAMDV